MKLKYMKNLLIFSAFVLMILLVGCSEKVDNFLTDLKDQPTPTITSISPATGYGGEEAVITGTGFSPVASENLITFGPGEYFGYKSIRPYEATATELKFEKPIISGPAGINIDTHVKVSLINDASQTRSNALPITFLPLFFTQTFDEEIVWPMGVDVDDAGNVYAGSAADGIIYKYDASAEFARSEFATVAVRGAIHFGPGGALYVANLETDMIYKVSVDGATVEDYVACDNVVDFDWDENGNLWMCSTQFWDSETMALGMHVYDGSTVTWAAEFTSPNDEVGGPKSCRVFDGYVYMCGIDWNPAKGFMYKYPISGTTLGPAEVVMEADDDDFPISLEFDKKGTLYYARAWDATLYTISSAGAEGSMYADEIVSPARYMTYHGKALYMVYPGWGDVGTVMMANIGVEQAPRYGRQ